MGTAAAPALRVERLTKRWPNRPQPVLDGLSLLLRRGDAAGVCGANGTGKTTLLRTIAGLLDPDGGTVALEGQSPLEDRRAARRRVGYLSAGGTALYARLTGLQHLRLWADLAFVPRPQVPERIDHVVAAFGLEELLHRRMDRLSQGQRQRVRLALTFLPQPPVLLLDEPDTSLDEEGRGQLRAEVARAREGGAAVVWCAPDPPAGLARAATMRLAGGRLRAA